MYWELFQTHCPSDEISARKQQHPLYFKDEPLTHCLGMDFNDELYQHTLISQSNKATTLKANLSTAQHLISKEALRNAHLHLAQFYTQTGSYDDAISHLKRVKEYSNPGAQLMEVTLLLAELGLAMGNYSLVQSLYDTNLLYNNNLHHLMSTHVSNMEQHEISFRYKWNIARGIAFMAQGYYKEAYKSFMSMSPSNEYYTSDTYFLVHTKDIAMYTGLMALMVLNRKDMEDCMSKTVFKSRFDSMIGIKDAMLHYSRANYGDCMNALSTMYSR
jgi:tetratricopeptide (TPR) repeat protein